MSNDETNQSDVIFEEPETQNNYENEIDNIPGKD